MSDFDAQLQARLSRNAELAEERRQAEQEVERAAEQRLEAQRRAQEERAETRKRRHAELAAELERLAVGLKQASPEEFVVRSGWTASGEEYMAKITTRGLEPKRSLLIELDHDDDEVLARWRSEVGDSLELWRLLEVTPELLSELLLQVADQELWRGARKPPAFPGAAKIED